MTYPGGKAKTFHHILNLIPPHQVYIEPFLGHGSVLRAKRPSQVEIALDVSPQVVRCEALEARGVRLIAGDGIEFLGQYPFEGHEVVYCDPPYVPETRRRARVYKYDTTTDDHVRLLELLSSLDARVIVSGYDSRLYRQALGHWNTRSFTAKAHNGLRQERLWFNYEAPAELHDYRYLGATYRERQTIKRRLARFKQRINGLSPQERAYVRQWLLQGGSEHAD